MGRLTHDSVFMKLAEAKDWCCSAQTASKPLIDCMLRRMLACGDGYKMRKVAGIEKNTTATC